MNKRQRKKRAKKRCSEILYRAAKFAVTYTRTMNKRQLTQEIGRGDVLQLARERRAWYFGQVTAPFDKGGIVADGYRKGPTTTIVDTSKTLGLKQFMEEINE